MQYSKATKSISQLPKMRLTYLKWYDSLPPNPFNHQDLKKTLIQFEISQHFNKFSRVQKD